MAVAVEWELSEDKMDRIIKVKLSEVSNSYSLLFDLKEKVFCSPFLNQIDTYDHKVIIMKQLHPQILNEV